MRCSSLRSSILCVIAAWAWSCCPGAAQAQATDFVFDDGFDCRAFRDLDGDGFGNRAVVVPECSPPAGYVALAGDCNDNDVSINPNAVDAPEGTFADTNCDGIDGDVAGAVFVDTVTGGDANDGGIRTPKRTIGAAIIAAAPNRDVYVAAGSYPELVQLASGVGVFGGYSVAVPGWTRAATNVTSISSPGPVGVRAVNLAAPTELQLLRISSANAIGPAPGGEGLSSAAIVVTSSSGLTVRNCTLIAGSGSAAAAQTNGSTGANGSPGGNGSGTSAGPSGASACGATGGSGAPGVSGPTSGVAGSSGIQAPSGGAAGSGGTGGASGSCSGTSSSNGGPAPAVLSIAGGGAVGTNGNAGAPVGVLDPAGDYVPASGSAGSTGRPGGGGGGGGSGGGSANGNSPSTDFCTSCTAISSGAGGGGGGGGCGGGGAPGGRGGGGSFGLVAASSVVSLIGTTVQTSTGGTGGIGGSGGLPGGGGSPGSAGAGQIRSNACSTRFGGDGAGGVIGASGGRGGGGAGGSGGPSICVAYQGTAPTVAGGACTLGAAGSGGTGGTNGAQTAANGPTGVANDIRSL